ncbi:MAG TPA: hypothetical protein VFX81_05995 [Burkholderiaceae bacterium]|nr:hypothetical protein [Burkholderiaceae bacterium]
MKPLTVAAGDSYRSRRTPSVMRTPRAPACSSLWPRVTDWLDRHAGLNH